MCTTRAFLGVGAPQKASKRVDKRVERRGMPVQLQETCPLLQPCLPTLQQTRTVRSVPLLTFMMSHFILLRL